MSLQAFCVHDDGRQHPTDGTLPCPIVEAVASAYDEQGQRIWWDVWDKANREDRLRMERAITGDGMGT